MSYYKLTIDGKDKTDLFNSRLKSITIIDRSGLTSDTATIKIVDSPDFELPDVGKSLEISLNGINKGTYTINKIDLTANNELIITAKAFDYKSHLKTFRNRFWDCSLQEMAKELADINGLKSAIYSEYKDKRVQDQQNESDLHFLTRLSKEIGGFFKIDSGYLLFFPNNGKTTSGKDLTPIKINNGFLNLSYSMFLEKTYTGVKTYFWDKKKGERVSIEVGDSSDQYILDLNWNNRHEATNKANNKLKNIKNKNKSLTFTVYSTSNFNTAEIICGQPLSIDGVRPSIDGKWIATELKHHLDDKGLFSTIKCEV